MDTTTGAHHRCWPAHGWVGLALVAIFWPLNWLLPGLRSYPGFFPLWLGYCLTVDALVVARRGHSLLTRNPRAYAGLFLASAPSWWLFELINWRTQNWHYLGREFLTPLEHFLISSVSFSTVMPAVFGTAELASTFGWIKRLKRGPLIAPTPATLRAFLASGGLLLVLLLCWPRYFFPLVWISVFFLIEPVNVWRKNRSLAGYTAEGDWRPIVALGTGCLICGFFWELWNYYSYPKWVYQVPFVGFARVFEMPLLGYGGYLPFALELFALYHLIVGLLRPKRTQAYLRISPEES